MIKLSIIIPVYNVERYLEKCLRSCLSQDIPHNEYEIIVVNDGSPDGSLAIAERIAESATNITIITQENGGLSVARNTGMSVAKGDYIWFVDSDDWIETNCLKQLTDALYNEQLDAMVINGVKVIDNKETKIKAKEYEGCIFTGLEYLNKAIINCAAVKTIYKRTILKENNISFLSGIYHEDAEFTPRAYYTIKRVKVTNCYYYYNRLNPNSITQTANPKKGFDLLTVALSLYNYKQDKAKEYKKIYDKYIASVINQSLSNTVSMNNDTLNIYISKITQIKYLFKSFNNHPGILYKTEGLLFRLFPSKCVAIYQFIKKFKQ